MSFHTPFLRNLKKSKMMRRMLFLMILISGLTQEGLFGQNTSQITVKGRGFELNGQPFEFTGISFFNALYNPAFNESPEKRKEYLKTYQDFGINVIRVWCQWDNQRGFIDGGEGKTLYNPEGTINSDVFQRITDLLEDADETGTVVLLVLFSRESWNENIRLEDEASNRAVEELTKRLKPYRNVIFQIWNEHDYRTVDYLKIIKSIDKERLVTNSPGYGGVLGSSQENFALDYLSPHTTRDDDRHWEVAANEVRYLLSKYNKPVVDDEPARKGTPQFGGPRTPTLASDKILHIYNIWKEGGYVIYHHDMFQTGYRSEAIPPSGIPLPGFSTYHDEVFNLLKNKARYLKNIRTP